MSRVWISSTVIVVASLSLAGAWAWAQSSETRPKADVGGATEQRSATGKMIPEGTQVRSFSIW